MGVIPVLWHMINVVLYIHKAFLNQIGYEGYGFHNATNVTFVNLTETQSHTGPLILNAPPILLPSLFYRHNSTHNKTFPFATIPKKWISFTAVPNARTRSTVASKTRTRPTTAPKNRIRLTTAPETRTRPTAVPNVRTRPTVAPKTRTRPTAAPKTRTRLTTAPETRTRPTAAPKFRTIPTRRRILISNRTPWASTTTTSATASTSTETTPVPSLNEDVILLNRPETVLNGPLFILDKESREKLDEEISILLNNLSNDATKDLFAKNRTIHTTSNDLKRWKKITTPPTVEPTTTFKPTRFTHCNKTSDCIKGQKCMLSTCVLDVTCPTHLKFGRGPPKHCNKTPTDPNRLPPSPLESWFTKEAFDDLFPKANIGWGPVPCWPYSYEAFAIAARYFPEFGTESPNNGYSENENRRRDLAAFFAHAVQETGENDASIYDAMKNQTTQKNWKQQRQEQRDACFYRGGFFNWFEGGPISSFLPTDKPGYQPKHGDVCKFGGRYCGESTQLDYWFPCNQEKMNRTKKGKTSGRIRVSELYKGCYFGRGAIQISYNYNYGQFQAWLASKNVFVDLLENPNLVMTKMDPPLAVMASLWFYMTPQPPKPAMHDIVMGNWEAGELNKEAGYFGPIFGPTSLVINNECNGEDEGSPGGPGESRRIKAFKWFTGYFGVSPGEERLLSCKEMPVRLADIPHPRSYQPNWATTWKEQPCDCAPALYGGMIPYFEKGHYPERFVNLNKENRVLCVKSIYDNPVMYSLTNDTSVCLNHASPFL